jgi:hypothetical protein
MYKNIVINSIKKEIFEFPVADNALSNGTLIEKRISAKHTKFKIGKPCVLRFSWLVKIFNIKFGLRSVTKEITMVKHKERVRTFFKMDFRRPISFLPI